MKTMSWSQLNKILAIVIGTAFLFALVSGLCYRGQKTIPDMGDAMDLNESWIIQTDEAYDRATDLPCHLEAAKGEAISISHFLPDDIGNDYGIAFRSVYNEVQVKIGDTVIYQYGVEEHRPFLHAPVPNWNFVPIDQQYAGELLTITQISEYGKYSGLFPAIQIGSRSALLYAQWKQNGWGLLLSVMLLVFMVGLLCVAVGIRIHRTLDLRFRYYIILVAVIALWSISGSPLLSVYFQNGYLLWMLHIVFRMVIPMAYLMFLRGYAQKKQLATAIDIGLLCAGLLYVTVVILQLMGLLEFAVTYDTLGTVYSVGFLAYTAALWIGWMGYKRKELAMITVANTFLSIAGVIHFFVRPNHLYQTEGAFWQLSIMCYLFILLAAVLAVVIRQMNETLHHAEEGYSGQRAVAVAMMNPNFLFASLNSLLSMIKAGSGSAAKFVFAFSKYLRYNLDSVREEKMIPFQEELGHIAAYLEIQQMRMPEMKVAIEDKIHDFMVPARSIEAIVENAVKHGIAKKQCGQVIVRSYERRDSYAIQIVDEGMGFDTDMLYRKQTPTSMAVIRKRLEEYNGAVIEVTSKHQKGTIVTVKLPKTKTNAPNTGAGQQA